MDYTNSQIKALINEYIHSERDRRLLERRLVDGITFEQLGNEFDRDPRQLRRKIYKLQEILFKHL